MKECPYCLSQIADDARKCRFCGEWVEEPSEGSGEPAAPRDQSLSRFWESEDLDETLNVGVKWYVKYRIAMTIVGFVVFVIFFFGVWLPQWNQMNDGPGVGPPPVLPVETPPDR